MKCPNCGFWNRAQFPKCFQCGQPLDGSEPSFAMPPERRHGDEESFLPHDSGRPHSLFADADSFQEELVEFDEFYAPPSASTVGDTAVYSAALPLPGASEALGQTKQSKGVGERLGGNASGADISGISRLERDFPVRPAPLPQHGKPIEVLEHENIYVRKPAPKAAPASEPRTRKLRKKVRNAPSAEPQTRRARESAQVYGAQAAKKTELKPLYTMKDKRKRRSFLRAFFKLSTIAAFIVALSIGGYILFPKIDQMFSTSSGDFSQDAGGVNIPFTIETVERNERSAHEIVFRSDKYESVYIQELKSTYLFTAGEARMLLYDDLIIGDAPEHENMSVQLTPVFYHPSGKQELGGALSYELLIPQTKIELIQPESDSASVQTSITPVKFRVSPGSRVLVNGSDVSDFTDSNGNVLQNIDTSEFGDIAVVIRAQTPGHTATEKTITLNRPYMDIPIELAATVSGSSTSKTVELRGTTLPGATISLDTSQSGEGEVDSDGSFTVKALMTRIGVNQVIIRATMPGKEDTLYHLTIDYAPKLDEYSKQAWPIDSQNFGDLMSYSENKVGKIYVGTGIVTAISDDSPAIYTMDMGENIIVLIRMVEGKKLELGNNYKIYCDFEAMQSGRPLFVGRYYYNQ
ncbi:MAG: hypothetical protein ACOX8S_06960 [Christensenellales bacterium]